MCPECDVDQKNDLPAQHALLVFDYKEKIRLGRKRVETGDVFFNRPLRSLFTVIVYYKEDGELCEYIYNFVSEDISNDAEFTTQCLTKASNIWISCAVV